MVNRVLIVAVAAAGCASFEDPDIVIDLRVLAMDASPPNQVVDIDLTQPVMPAALLAQISPTVVCALVADPGLQRRLAWSMSLCPLSDDERCADGTEVALGSGVIEDPETSAAEPRLCATVLPDANLFSILYDTLLGDDLRGLGGVYYAVQLRVGGELADRNLDQYAVKTLQVVPRIPAEVRANVNPTLTRVDVRNDQVSGSLLFGRCVNDPDPRILAPSARLQITPIEARDVRETYVVPTLDGNVKTFTETLTYQWMATAGGFSDGSTGGPRDISGNKARLSTEYRAPNASELTGPLDVSIWLVQRDERLGVKWFELCLRIVP